MSSIDNRHGNLGQLRRSKSDRLSHEGHVISLDAVRLARPRGGDEGIMAARADSQLPCTPERASGSSSTRSADVVHLPVGQACPTGSGNSESSTSSSPTSCGLSGTNQTSTGPSGPTATRSGLPDLAAIAREPDYVRRRSELVNAMTFFCGSTVSERLVDHQMIISGLAAGHGSTGDGAADDDPWPLGSSMDDPAVVVGLVLHHVRQIGGRDLPIPPFVMRQLDRHACLGSPAARLVRDWMGKRSIGNDRQPSHNSPHLQVHDGGKP